MLVKTGMAFGVIGATTGADLYHVDNLTHPVGPARRPSLLTHGARGLPPYSFSRSLGS
jgi:hypothetical protein